MESQQTQLQGQAGERRVEGIPAEVVAQLKDLIMVVARLVVDHPDAVEVHVVPAAYRLIAELHTDPRDVGQVVGRNAYLITSLRSFVAAFSGRVGIKMDLDFVTEHDNARDRELRAGGARRR
jgi:predicted RNA-binding protein YlqC (UPF0109 family)